MKIVSANTPTPPETQGLNTKISQVVANLNNQMQKNAGIQTQEHPVPNPSKVTAEDMTAIRQPSQETSVETKEEIGQPDTKESAPKAPESTDSKADSSLSAQYAQLARKEKAMRAEAQRLKAEKAQFDKERQEALAPKPTIFDPDKHLDRQKFQDDPLGALSDIGLTYDQIVQAQLNAPSPEMLQLQKMLKAQAAEITELKNAQEGVKKTFEEQASNSYKQALNQISQEASKLIHSDPNYETIKATRNTKEVVNLIESTWKEEGRLMTVEEACEEVENYLVDEAQKLFQLSKLQKRFKPAEVPASNPAKAAADPNTQKSKTTTLTNSMTTSRQYSAKERAVLAAQYGPNWRSKVS